MPERTHPKQTKKPPADLLSYHQDHCRGRGRLTTPTRILPGGSESELCLSVGISGSSLTPKIGPGCDDVKADTS